MIEDSGPAFGQSLPRAQAHLLSHLVGLGRHTITGLLRTQNRLQKDWSADYRLYCRERFDQGKLFDCICQEAQKLLDPQAPLIVAMDDSLLPKSGRKIPGAKYQRDPQSPAFRYNLVRGLRILQLSAALPKAARMVPIGFEIAGFPPKPKRQASAQELQEYERLRAQARITRLGKEQIHRLRRQLDEQGSGDRYLIVAIDGRFTNTTVLKRLPSRTTVIGRIRKDTALFYGPARQKDRGRKRKYGERAPTPQQLLKAPSQDFQTVTACFRGQPYELQVKTMDQVVMRSEGGFRQIRVLAVKPLGYRLKKGGKLLYRQPAYLICTDPKMTVEEILRIYLLRWDIEVNFRDEKSLLGIGQPQVRNKLSVQKAPALNVAAYAMLLLAAAKAYGDDTSVGRTRAPKWYRKKSTQRLSTQELINQLRYEMWASSLRPQHFQDFSSNVARDQKSQKFEPSLAAAVFTCTA